MRWYALIIREPAGLFYLPNTFAMISPLTYLKHVREEFAHVVWPSNRTALGHTLVVIFIAAVIALLVALLDYAFGSVVNRLIVG